LDDISKNINMKSVSAISIKQEDIVPTERGSTSGTTADPLALTGKASGCYGDDCCGGAASTEPQIMTGSIAL